MSMGRAEISIKIPPIPFKSEFNEDVTYITKVIKTRIKYDEEMYESISLSYPALRLEEARISCEIGEDVPWELKREREHWDRLPADIMYHKKILLMLKDEELIKELITWKCDFDLEEEEAEEKAIIPSIFRDYFYANNAYRGYTLFFIDFFFEHKMFFLKPEQRI